MEKLQDLIIYDTRLYSEGLAPDGMVLTVSPTYPLRLAITWVIVKSDSYNHNVRVRIMAHGAPGCVFFCDDGMHLDLPEDLPMGAGPHCVDPSSLGGLPNIEVRGMICLPSYGRQSSLPAYRAWQGYVKQIDIMGCDTARIERAGTWTDGNVMCSRLAYITGAYVRASTNTLFYPREHPNIPISRARHFAGWDGVMTYAPSGAVVAKSPYDESPTWY